MLRDPSADDHGGHLEMSSGMPPLQRTTAKMLAVAAHVASHSNANFQAFAGEHMGADASVCAASCAVRWWFSSVDSA
jgi:hypothetical protein